MKQRLALGFALGFALGLAAAPTLAAPPGVPGTMSYQGVLLDSGGQPQTGNVDLTVRVYDAISGGTLLYKQTLTGVALVDGVFSVTLGPTGAATDTPVNPVTASFPAALAGDLAATGPSRFLEVTVGGAGALPRTQLLAVPYALRAASAEVATSAEVAASADTVTGVPSEFLGQSLLYGNFDGGGPLNGAPDEGVADADGDGIANFVDPDNDSDGLSDIAEAEQGSALNLVTPVVSAIEPPQALWSAGATLTVSGLHFEPGMSVAVGDQSPTPQAVTATSFEVTVGPSGKRAPVVVTRLNGESDSLLYGVASSLVPGFVADQVHGVSFDGKQISLDARGAQQVILGDRYDSNGDGLLDADLDPAGADFDAVAWSTAGRASKLSDWPSGIKFYTDQNFDFVFQTDEYVLIQPGTVLSADILVRPLGHKVAAYLLTASGSHFAVVAHDRDLQGGFLGTNEIVQIEPIVDPAPNRGRVAADASGAVAFAYYDQGADLLRLAWDRSGDGDYDDTVTGNPELTTLVATPTLTCVGVAFDGAGVLAVVYDAGAGPVLARDLDGDGDFDGAGEYASLGAAPAAGCDVAARGARLAVVHDSGHQLVLLVDRDGDGDFDGTAERRILGYADSVLPAEAYAPMAVALSETGRAIVATGDLFLDIEP